MNCKGCGAQLRGTELFCPYCGTGVETTNPNQPQGAQHIHIHNHYEQPQYSYSQPQPQRQPYAQPAYSQPYGYGSVSPKNRVVMLLLWFFLGIVGGHCFYAGQTGKGILYLLTGGLCGIGLLVDLVILLVGTPRDKQGRPIVW